MQRKTFSNNISKEPVRAGEDFSGLGIAPRILEILEKIKFKTPTPIQFKTIPLAIEGKDIISIAQTGTGKTHAFAIPMVQRLMQVKGIGLVVAPTRELAVQIDEAMKPLARVFSMSTACLIGGAPMHLQKQALRRDPRVVIATPGRLLDHARQWNVMLENVSILVLDEADRMLDMGFAPQVNQILHFVPKEKQMMLFSATIPKEIMEMASRYMKLPVCVEVAASGTTADNVSQELFIVKKEDKLRLLRKLLGQYRGSVLLFSRTKHKSRKIAREIRQMGYRAAEMHSDRSLNQRRDALEGFKSGKYRVLVATDIAARGIDVVGIELVINFDLPDDTENYVHRIGRTARAGRKGLAISFAMPDQAKNVGEIEKLIRAPLRVSRHPDISAEQFKSHSEKPRFKSKPKRRHGYFSKKPKRRLKRRGA